MAQPNNNYPQQQPSGGFPAPPGGAWAPPPTGGQYHHQQPQGAPPVHNQLWGQQPAAAPPQPPGQPYHPQHAPPPQQYAPEQQHAPPTAHPQQGPNNQLQGYPPHQQQQQHQQQPPWGGHPPPTTAAPPQQLPAGYSQGSQPPLPPGQQQEYPPQQTTQQQAGYPQQQPPTPQQPQQAYSQPQPQPQQQQQQQQGGPNGTPPPQAQGQQQHAAGGSPQPKGANGSFAGNANPNRTAVAKRARPRRTANKIDSAHVPTPARDLPTAGPAQPRPVVNTSKGTPPLSITNYVAVDDGNASSKFLRPTLHAAPADETLLKDSNVPWSMVLSPLNAQYETPEERPPLVSGRPPVRCDRCRAYMNPNCAFGDLGKRWSCVFCGMVNETDSDAFSNLDNYGRRRDAQEKPEYSRGSVEYDVNGIEAYLPKNPAGDLVQQRPMAHLFLVDVSKAAEAYLPSLVDSLRTAIAEMATYSPRCRVSFVTFADTLHFYNFSQESLPQLVVPDVSAPFVPLPFTLLCWMNVADDQERIAAFLDRLLTLPAEMDEEGCAAGAALEVASLILSETGGKVIITATAAPNVGVGAVAVRDVHKLYTTDTEKQLFRPVEGFWPSIAVDCAKKQITVDLLVFPKAECELCTIGVVPHLTGGAQSHFGFFSVEKDSHRLHGAVLRSLVEEAGYSSVVRVRCSQGLRVQGYHGHFTSTDPQDMDLAGISSSNTFVVDLAHEGKLDGKGYGYVQLALLYTTRNGDRRVRVHTLKMAVCTTQNSLFRNADLEATVVTLLYHGVREAVNKGTKAARAWITEYVLRMLVSYRRYCAAGSHTGQLLLPEQLKLFPLYALCAMKSDALVTGTSVAIDNRVQSMFDLMSMPVHVVLQYLYPRLYALQTTLNHQSTGLPREDGVRGVYMPPVQQLTSDTIMCHGIYALLDRQVNLVYLWIGSGVAPRVSAALLGGNSDATSVEIASFDSWHERIRAVLEQMVGEGMARIMLIKEGGGGMEEAFFRCMLEDEAVPNGQTYSDFLCYLHKAINAKLA